MTYRIQEALLGNYKNQNMDDMIEEYLEHYRSYLRAQRKSEQIKEIKSGYNRMNRTEMWSSEAMNLSVKRGDICFIDYGKAYLNEAGYQHFGLVLREFNQKILVVPMTSNKSAIKHSRNYVENGKKHLYYIGHLDGLHKPSTLFLNDFKFVNSSRIISINGHLKPDSEMFQEILEIIKTEIIL